VQYNLPFRGFVDLNVDGACGRRDSLQSGLGPE
jgi:hypothetical protein